MTTYLNNDGADGYQRCCRYSLIYGVIGPSTFVVRMAALRELCASNSPIWQYANAVLLAEEWGDEEEWRDDEQERKGEGGNGSGGAGQSDIADHDDDGSILRFILGPHTGLSEWELHKGDADPNPSVPHGHLRSTIGRSLTLILDALTFAGFRKRAAFLAHK